MKPAAVTSVSLPPCKSGFLRGQRSPAASDDHARPALGGGAPRTGTLAETILSRLVLPLSLTVTTFAVNAQVPPLASAQVEHPAVLNMVTDRRLRTDPDEMSGLVATVMKLDELELLALIGKQHGLLTGHPCPSCGAAKLTFDLSAPDSLTCAECGGILRDDTLPVSGTLSGTDGVGEPLAYDYHQKGYRQYHVAARIRATRNHRLGRAARALGQHYHENRDPASARQAAVILDRFASVYRYWPVVQTTHPRSYRTVYELNPERPHSHWEFARWDRLFMYEIAQDCVFAYDLTYASLEWDKLSKERGYDVRRHVEEKLFREMCRFAWEAHADQGGKLTNLNPTLYQRTIHLGRVLNDPGMVHRAVAAMQDMVRVSYHFDAMEYEGTMSYHGVVTGRLGIGVRMLSGYRDPPGYVDQEFGVNLATSTFGEQFPTHGRAWGVWNRMAFPDGRPVCVHDTSWRTPAKPVADDAPAPNIELNAYGHYAVGRGVGPDAMQAHLHFCPRYAGGHFHTDRLGLILWAAGQEMLPDIGYVHVGGKHRYFVNRAICHNTVQVLFDEPPQKPQLGRQAPLPTDPVQRFKAQAQYDRPVDDARSSLLAYDPGITSGKRVHLVAASSPGPEWFGIQERTRALIMVGIDETRSYLVDVFRVAGGDAHRFVLRPNADEEMATVCDLTFKPIPNTLAGPDVPYGQVTKGIDSYSWLVHDLKSAKPIQPWSLTWTGEDSGAAIRAFFRPLDQSEVLLGRSPNLRRAKHDSRLADDFQGPHLLVTRRGEPGSVSIFAAVYECRRKGQAFLVESVDWRAGMAADTGTDAVVASIRIGEREDLVYVSWDDLARPIGGVAFSGDYAVLSRKGRKPSWGWVQGNARIKAAGLALHSGVPQRRQLTRVLRKAGGDEINGFVVAGEVPADAGLDGQWLRVILGDGKAYGYRIKALQDRTSASVTIETDDEPGFTLAKGGAELLFNPFYETHGSCTVEISPSAFAETASKGK